MTAIVEGGSPRSPIRVISSNDNLGHVVLPVQGDASGARYAADAKTAMGTVVHPDASPRTPDPKARTERRILKTSKSVPYRDTSPSEVPPQIDSEEKRVLPPSEKYHPLSRGKINACLNSFGVTHVSIALPTDIAKGKIKVSRKDLMNSLNGYISALEEKAGSPEERKNSEVYPWIEFNELPNERLRMRILLRPSYQGDGHKFVTRPGLEETLVEKYGQIIIDSIDASEMPVAVNTKTRTRTGKESQTAEALSTSDGESILAATQTEVSKTRADYVDDLMIEGKDHAEIARKCVKELVDTYLGKRTESLVKSLNSSLNGSLGTALLMAFDEIDAKIKGNYKKIDSSALKLWSFKPEWFAGASASQIAGIIVHFNAEARDYLTKGVSVWMKEFLLEGEREIQTTWFEGILQEDFEAYLEQVPQDVPKSLTARVATRVRDSVPFSLFKKPNEPVVATHFPVAMREFLGPVTPSIDDKTGSLETLKQQVAVELPAHYGFVEKAHNAQAKIQSIQQRMFSFNNPDGSGTAKPENFSRIAKVKVTSLKGGELEICLLDKQGFAAIDTLRNSLLTILKFSGKSGRRNVENIRVLLNDVNKLGPLEQTLLFDIPADVQERDVLDAIELFNDLQRPKVRVTQHNIPANAENTLAFLTRQISYARTRIEYDALEERVKKVRDAVIQDKVDNNRGQSALPTQDVFDIMLRSVETDIEVAQFISGERTKVNAQLQSRGVAPIKWDGKSWAADPHTSSNAAVTKIISLAGKTNVISVDSGDKAAQEANGKNPDGSSNTAPEAASIISNEQILDTIDAALAEGKLREAYDGLIKRGVSKERLDELFAQS